MSESEGTGEECDEVTRRVRASERSDQPTLSFAMRGGSGGTGGAQRRREHPPVSQRAFPRRFTFRFFRLLSLSFRFHTFHHHLPPFPFTPHHTTPHRQHDALRCTELRIGSFGPNFTCLCLRACPAGTGKVSCVLAHEAHIRSCTRGTLFGPRVSVRGGLARIRSHVMRTAVRVVCVAVWRALGHMSCVCACAGAGLCALRTPARYPCALRTPARARAGNFCPEFVHIAPRRSEEINTKRNGRGMDREPSEARKKSPLSSTATRMCT